MSDMPSAILIEKSDVFGYFKGALTEQYVLEELTALGIKPFYWSPDNAKAEIEFLIQGEREVILICIFVNGDQLEFMSIDKTPSEHQ